ncbi:hypothetical protein LOAG_10445 [Loa loa]|uniref:Conserved secreted protein n=1 Tax=Loa loa TaxID=7209 RepID=A0A1I7V600_LOALO|nr:hypothetical protein LOAG_10445 [Loa loa]EFO18051.1 hypothetical protein LOAG_10445 [Loa loa]
MLFRLVIIPQLLQLLQFCLAGDITDFYRPRRIIEYDQFPMISRLSQTLEDVNNKPLPVYNVMTPKEVVENAEFPSMAFKSSTTVIAQQPNSMAYLAEFRLSSIDATSTATPVSTSGTIIGSKDDKNYMLATEQKMEEVYDNQPSNEIFKHRVVKMAVAPSNAPEVRNPYAAANNYESEIMGQKPLEEDQYAHKKKHR